MVAHILILSRQQVVGIGPIIVSEIYAVRRKNASSCYLT